MPASSGGAGAICAPLWRARSMLPKRRRGNEFGWQLKNKGSGGSALRDTSRGERATGPSARLSGKRPMLMDRANGLERFLRKGEDSVVGAAERASVAVLQRDSATNRHLAGDAGQGTS